MLYKLNLWRYAVGVTFKYTPEGPVGLAPEGKKAYVVYSSGGVPMGAEGMDHHTPLIAVKLLCPFETNGQSNKNSLGFIGIKDVTLIGASGTMVGLYKLNPVDTYLESASGFNACAPGFNPLKPVFHFKSKHGGFNP